MTSSNVNINMNSIKSSKNKSRGGGGKTWSYEECTRGHFKHCNVYNTHEFILHMKNALVCVVYIAMFKDLNSTVAKRGSGTNDP